jgi:AbrB family looped-hinge helix DNA binding protein
METTVMSSKGQIIIPKALRDSYRWQLGTKLEVHETAEGLLLKPVLIENKNNLHLGLQAIRAGIAYKGPALSIKEMNAAVTREAAGKRKV